MKNVILAFILALALTAALVLSGCGSKTQELVINGAPGLDGISMGVDVSSTAPTCLSGGATIRTFVDSDRNGALDSGEIVKQVSVVCNGVSGTNGIDGTSVTVSTASSTECPNGGVVLNGITPICNGENGAMGPQGEVGLTGPAGPQGATGPQGIPGIDGADGAQGIQGEIGPVGPQGPQGVSGGVGNMVPVQLCPGDTGAYKEFGFIVGTQLFAVYFDKNQLIAFLALLNPGNYITTNGANCTFTYSNNGAVATLSNSSGTTTVNLNSISPPTPSGTCSVVNQNNSSNSYLVTTSGTILNSTGTLEIVMNGGAITGHNYSGGSAEAGMQSQVYSFKPNSGVANSFLVYKSSGGSISSAKVTTGSGGVVTCAVTN